MKQVMDAFKRKDVEKRLRVIRMEIDYELATLHDALTSNDQEQIKRSKENLEKFRLELLRLEG